MANAESPDPSTDLVPATNEGEEVDPVAPAPEPKVLTRKDATLKEFLSKMDDYAPIVSRALVLSIIFHSDIECRSRTQ
jgi:transcription initiation factor TFIID subunit 10